MNCKSVPSTFSSSFIKVFWKGEVRSRTGDPRFRARRITTAPDGRLYFLTKVFWKGEFEGTVRRMCLSECGALAPLSYLTAKPSRREFVFCIKLRLIT